MKGKRYSDEQIVRLLSRPMRQWASRRSDLVREHGISEQSFYRWKSKYGGMEVSEARAAEGAGSREREAEEAAGRGRARQDPCSRTCCQKSGRGRLPVNGWQGYLHGCTTTCSSAARACPACSRVSRLRRVGRDDEPHTSLPNSRSRLQEPLCGPALRCAVRLACQRSNIHANLTAV